TVHIRVKGNSPFWNIYFRIGGRHYPEIGQTYKKGLRKSGESINVILKMLLKRHFYKADDI
ncbi:MAG TPA: hypothetical protein VFM18_13035, partial [Methanosarcina sp.]|nr:hypothetical protein [Methanosarcina sp.]